MSNPATADSFFRERKLRLVRFVDDIAKDQEIDETFSFKVLPGTDYLDIQTEQGLMSPE